MKHKFIKILGVLIVLIFAVALMQTTVFALTDGDYEYTVSDGKATITGYIGAGGNVVIPSTLGGYPVTAIDGSVFSYKEKITAVTIPEGVTSIGNLAFWKCSNLETVTLPSTLEIVGNDAFQLCNKISRVNIADIEKWCAVSFTADSSNPLARGETFDKLYVGGELVHELVIPEGVTDIGEYAFFECRGLTSVTLPSTLESIGEDAFNGCSSLQSISIPESVTSIGNFAFDSCTSLNDIYYFGTSAGWDEVTKGSDWNYKCPCGDNVHFIYTYTVEDGKATITAYNGPGGNVVIPSTLGGYPVTAIGDNAFYVKTKITAVTIPEGVTSIGDLAFWGCSSLETVTLPSTLESVGLIAFSNCAKLSAVNVADIAKWCSVSFSGAGSNPLCVGDDLDILYVGGELIHELVIPEGVTSIGKYAFYKCHGLTSVIFPSTLESIGSDAFYNCTSLSDIYFLGTATEWDNIEKYESRLHTCPCEQNAHIVYTYTVEDGKATITAYDGPGGNAVIPSTLDGYPVTAIGNQAFKNKGSITAVTIPEGVTSIREYAFIGCSKLETVTLPSTLEAVGGGAFIDCVKLSAVNVADIAAWCAVSFANFSSNPLARGETYDKLYVGGELIHELVIPEGVTDIGQYAFFNCAGLTSVTFPSTLVTIGDYAFENCTSLEIAIMPTSLKSIGEKAFYQIGNSKLVMQYLGTRNEWHEVTKGDDWSDYGQPNRMKYAYQYILSDGKATLTIYDGLGGDVVIPSTLDGYPVAAIGGSAFKDKTNVTAVTIPEGVTSIGNYAFDNCEGLMSVTFPSTLVTIGNCAFYSCKAIGSLTIPEGVTSIGNYAFESCEGLTSVTFPSTLVTIGDFAFYSCTAIGSLTIPEGVESIGDHAFDSCTAVKTVIFPESLKSIESCAFGHCNISNMFYLGTNAEWDAVEKGSSWYTDAFEIPNKLHVAYKYTLDDGKATLTSYSGPGGDVVIPSKLDGYPVTAIGENAVYLKSKLTGITIPEGVTSIAQNAFKDCSNLETVTLPSTLESVGENAFYVCYKINKVNVADIAKWCAVEFGDGWSNPLAVGNEHDKLYVGGELVHELVIPEGVTSIGQYAFDTCEGLTSVTLPSTLESVGEYAFSWCSNISAVNVADIAKWCAVEFVGGAANPLYAGNEHDKLYVGGKLIHDLVIPEGVTSIGDLAFYCCEGLTSVTLPSTLTSIGVGAFWYCTSLESITIPEGVKTIGEGAFENCTSLKSITIPEGVKTVNAFTFYSCLSLESVTIPNGVTSIDKFAFDSCTSLNDIYYFGTAAEWDALPKGNSCFTGNPKTQKIHYMCTVTVSSASDKTGSAAGGGACEMGVPVTVTATPAEHYVFVNWTVGEDIVSTDPTYEFTPTGDTELVANFALEKFKITFVDEYGEELWSGEFEYGTKPVYGGETPTKENDGDNEFTFCNWFPKIENATEEKTYITIFGIEINYFCFDCGEHLYCAPRMSDDTWHYAYCFNDECDKFAGLPVMQGYHFGGTATCTEKARCEQCDHIYGELDPDNHDWDDGVVAVEPTCTTDGEMLYTCKYDNSHTRTEVIPAKGHVDGEPVIENVAAPTCLTEGSYDVVTYCTVCGAETSRREVRQDPLGHSFGDWAVTKPATCTEKGEETRICANNPTHKETREIAPLGHDYGEWFVTVEPTENEEGLETRVCSICGAEESQSIAKLSHKHKMTHYPAVEPTETVEGQKEYYVCSGCGKWFEDAEGKKEITDHASVVIPALGKTEPIAYEFKVEPETEWVRGSGKDFVLTSMADFSKFIGAKVDGNFLDKSFFTAEEGSTKVAFKSEYLETLSAGEHTLTVVSEDGEASASVNIIADPVSPDTPTETSSSPVIWIIVALVVAAVAAAAVVVVIIVKKKKK